EGVEGGAGRQRPLQPRPARGAAESARRRRLGARGGGRLCRETQSAPARAGCRIEEGAMTTPNTTLWEVFIRSRNGLAHKHCGSLHAADATMALQAARDIYTRRGEG